MDGVDGVTDKYLMVDPNPYLSATSAARAPRGFMPRAV